MSVLCHACPSSLLRVADSHAASFVHACTRACVSKLHGMCFSCMHGVAACARPLLPACTSPFPSLSPALALRARLHQEMMAHKKAVQRMGKKSKDELAKINKDIEDRHAAELRALDAHEAGGSGCGAAAGAKKAAAPVGVEAAITGMVLGGGGGSDAGGDKKQSKGAKRRERLEREEASASGGWGSC
eukprot:356747-Chlamydomonas_euryale.AAC.1